MIQRDPSWTGKWVAARIRERPEVTNVQLPHPQILKITRHEDEPFMAATLATAVVDRATIETLASLGYQIDIFVNIPKEAIWTGEAISAAADNAASFGGMSDLHRAIDLPTPNHYINPEYRFVERGLLQHTKVRGLRRLYDRKYTIQRIGYDDITVVLLNEYDLTADHVRTARDRYGFFDAILMTNPNSRSTGAAAVALDSMDVPVYKWGELLSRLNRE